MAQIGIMGGTFNPIHLGHIAIAKAAYEQFHLTEVWFMPNHIPYYKSDESLISGADRLAMVGLAIQNIPYFKASDFEIKREGNTYTADTLILLREKYPQHSFYFIMGADSLFYFEKWKSPETIVRNAVILAAPRKEKDRVQVQNRVDDLNRLFGGIYFHLIDCPEVHCSSRDIRAQLVQPDIEGEQSAGSELYLSEDVYEYILQRRLYVNSKKSK